MYGLERPEIKSRPEVMQGVAGPAANCDARSQKSRFLVGA